MGLEGEHLPSDQHPSLLPETNRGVGMIQNSGTLYRSPRIPLVVEVFFPFS